MRIRLAVAVLALAGCGGDDASEARLAPPPTSADPAQLGCEEVTSVISDYGTDARGEGTDLVALARRDLEDELSPTDGVERLPGNAVRVVRGGRVIAILRYVEAPAGGGYVLGQIDACTAFVDS